MSAKLAANKLLEPIGNCQLLVKENSIRQVSSAWRR
jgi:hypothetical protein